jgi:magnesium chelatase subunit D
VAEATEIVASAPDGFPFAAVVGHDDAKLALLLSAVDPRLGGVLLRGDKGTAKSTLARGLAALLPDGAPFVELPLGATEDRVVGAVDVGAALGGDGWRIRPGLLAQAHGGVLYVDEVNLLPDHLVDVLLDAAASGAGRVERDGLSHTYPARFVLVGSMNPEEGELRPQLLDRFGLVVDLGGHGDPAVRAEAVRRRLAFEDGGSDDAATWAPATDRLRHDLAAATGRRAVLDGGTRLEASTVCAALGIETLRADLTLCRAATALARLEGDEAVDGRHLRRVAPLALVHRRRRGPFDPGHVDPGEIDDAFDQVGDPPTPGPPDVDDGEPAGHQHSGEDHRPAGGDGAEPSGPGDNRTRSGDQPGGEAPRSDPDDPADPADADGRPDGEVGSDERAPGRRPEAGGTTDGTARPRRDDERDRPGEPADPAAASVLHLVDPRPVVTRRRTAGAGPAVARNGAPATGGPVIGARPPADPQRSAGVAPAATLLAAAARRAGAPDGPALAGTDLREPIRAPRTTRTIVVALDTSGSMGAEARVEAVSRAVLGILLDAYQRRERIALVAVGGDRPRVVLQPTSSVEVARARLATLTPSGPTPLAEGLLAAGDLVERAGRDGDGTVLVVITDGRATAAPDDAAPWPAALAAAEQVAGGPGAIVVLDAEAGATRLGLARELAERLGARHVALAEVTATAVEQAIRTATTAG